MVRRGIRVAGRRINFFVVRRNKWEQAGLGTRYKWPSKPLLGRRGNFARSFTEVIKTEQWNKVEAVAVQLLGICTRCNVRRGTGVVGKAVLRVMPLIRVR
jgi:hypothetical protein